MPDTKTKSAAVARRPAAAAPDADEIVAQLAAEAVTPQDRERAFLVADALKQSKLVRGMASVVAATEWGAAMSPTRQAAFAKYCLALGADPLRHVDLLGGNPFVNGDYYRDVIAANPEFVRSEDPRWIHADKRLQLCVACGKPFEANVEHGHGVDEVSAENRRRLLEWIDRARSRTEENVPDDSPSACILVLVYKNGRGPFKGIGEVHPGKTEHGKDRDPIGLGSPRATAETRAWREAGEKAEATWFRTHASTLAQLEGKLKDAYRAEKASGPAEIERAPDPVVGEDPPPIAEIGPPAAPEKGDAPVPERVENHAPSAVCGVAGPHPASTCGYHRPTTTEVV